MPKHASPNLRTNWPAARPVVASCLACLAGVASRSLARPNAHRTTCRAWRPWAEGSGQALVRPACLPSPGAAASWPARPRPRWALRAAWCSAASWAMHLAEAERPKPPKQLNRHRRPSPPLLRAMTTSAGTSEATSARTSSSRCLRRTRTHRVIRREHKPGRALAHGSRHHGRRSTVRMRTLALAGAVAVSALALQPASPSTSGAQPSATAPAQPATPMRQMTVSALTDKDLVGARDNEVGDIERVVESNADKKQYLVISRGGFLGLFETEIVVPLENVAAQGDRIVLRNLTEEQTKALPKYTTDDKAYRELDSSQTVSLSEVK